MYVKADDKLRTSSTIFCATIPETFAPVLLRKRAAKLRSETGNPNITTEQELFNASLGQILTEALIRPCREFDSFLKRKRNNADYVSITSEMIATEPILLLTSLFVALIYGLLVGPSLSHVKPHTHQPRDKSMPSSSPSPLSSAKTTAGRTARSALPSSRSSSASASRYSSRPSWRRTMRRAPSPRTGSSE
jgi:hypothetical protein